jgi:uncharacterized OB-fold protein
MSDPPAPSAPDPRNATQRFWEATAENRLLVPFCAACEEYFYYPRGRCPNCASDGVEYREASGRGVLVSYTTVHRPPTDALEQRAPYINAIVRLDEGIRIMTNIEAANEEELSVGMTLEVTFVETDGIYKLPYFEPTNGR